MMFDRSFLAALGLLIVGSGLLKGNIATQVGELYPEDAGEQRTRAYAMFFMSVNLGAVAGPIACGFCGPDLRLARRVRPSRGAHGCWTDHLPVGLSVASSCRSP